MDPKPTSERLVDAIVQAHFRLEKRRPTAKPAEVQPFTIALSRDSGANGHLIARAVGPGSTGPSMTRNSSAGSPTTWGCARMLESLDEKGASWVQESLAGFITSAPAVDSGAYVHHLIETLFSLAAHGECVILGRGAAVLPAMTTLRRSASSALGRTGSRRSSSDWESIGRRRRAGSHKPTTTGLSSSCATFTRTRRTRATMIWSSIRRGWALKPAPKSSWKRCSACRRGQRPKGLLAPHREGLQAGWTGPVL